MVTMDYSAILSELDHAVKSNQPRDILQFCCDFFHTKLAQQRQSWMDQDAQAPLEVMEEVAHHPMDQLHPTAAAPTSPSTDITMFAPAGSPLSDQHVPTLQSSCGHYSSTDDDDDDDDISEEDDVFTSELPDFTTLCQHHNRGRRTSVSAESMTPSKKRGQLFQMPVIPKTQQQRERIREAIANNFLFKSLDENQYEDVVNAMSEKRVQPDEKVIQQGDVVGDYFYIVEQGTLDCFINDQHVVAYGPGGSFGELALMYNSPRAATIVATSHGVLWALDRVTFRRILMENTAQKRYMYETFLAEVPILASLDAYERYKIADALETVYFNDGDTVIQQGTVGENFYLIEAGEAGVYQVDPVTGAQKQVNCLGKGGYFGELALLNDSPRAATVIAHGRLRCATLGKRGFKRLLGPIMDILKRNSENYARVMGSVE
ncbi:hypothetical protein LRAMOSA00041 [Lichtheimia ramosa]|uniref:cAMP-dependent protein kinase regulatory subunit n=1 Tax=Lichtheimia ramosa TaxID=688394 RepID=A0A077W6H3_9FUNG|nr:hypothetical protein LRAMOSA00041 [Lichtheimia ramosa]